MFSLNCHNSRKIQLVCETMCEYTSTLQAGKATVHDNIYYNSFHTSVLHLFCFHRRNGMFCYHINSIYFFCDKLPSLCHTKSSDSQMYMSSTSEAKLKQITKCFILKLDYMLHQLSEHVYLDRLRED